MHILKWCQRKLWIKVLVPMVGAQILILGSIIYINVLSQHSNQMATNKAGAENLALAIEGGMIDALAIGDNDVVVEQFNRLRERVAGLEVMIFDFKGDVTFATDPQLIGKNLQDYISDPTALQQISGMLNNGQIPDRDFEERLNGSRHMSLFKSIPNESRCFHCHGRSRQILGGMQIRTSVEHALQASQLARDISILGGLIGLTVLGAIVFFLFTLLVNKPVKRLLDLGDRMEQGDLTHRVAVHGRDEISHISNRMNRVNDSLKTMIHEITSFSHDLSEGAASQAASLEQTSAAINEMATMIKQNMDSATQADGLMKAADHDFIRSKESMQEVTDAMNAIAKTSLETSQIIKTIDGIAFQTNLLALNASVEAARAGEAGAGFAVVADEVRNLALRAADAAKNTSVLIDEIADKISAGADRVTATNTDFSKLAAKIETCSQLIAEIATASNEQTQGIDQINQTVVHIDRSTQENASLAERLALSTERFKTGDSSGA